MMTYIEGATGQAGRLQALAEAEPAKVEGSEFRRLPLGAIHTARGQARKNFDDTAMKELADSVRSQGVLQPVTVRPKFDGTYELVMGERRLRAAQMAGLASIPAVICKFNSYDAELAGLAENLLREDLTPVEAGEKFSELLKQGNSYRSLAQALGISKGYIEDRVRIARGPDEVREMVRRRPDTLTHAREICALKDSARRRDAVKKTLNGMPLASLRVMLKEQNDLPQATSEPQQPEQNFVVQCVSAEQASNLEANVDDPMSGRPDIPEPKEDESQSHQTIDAQVVTSKIVAETLSQDTEVISPSIDDPSNLINAIRSCRIALEQAAVEGVTSTLDELIQEMQLLKNAFVPVWGHACRAAKA